MHTEIAIIDKISIAVAITGFAGRSVEFTRQLLIESAVAVWLVSMVVVRVTAMMIAIMGFTEITRIAVKIVWEYAIEVGIEAKQGAKA